MIPSAAPPAGRDGSEAVRPPRPILATGRVRHVGEPMALVVAETEAAAETALAKAEKIYGGHMGASLAEHGIWGTPERVVECIQRHVERGCTGFVIEFFGRDTREPARLFAESVMPAFREPA